MNVGGRVYVGDRVGHALEEWDGDVIEEEAVENDGKKKCSEEGLYSIFFTNRVSNFASRYEPPVVWETPNLVFRVVKLKL